MWSGGIRGVRVETHARESWPCPPLLDERRSRGDQWAPRRGGVGGGRAGCWRLSSCAHLLLLDEGEARLLRQVVHLHEVPGALGRAAETSRCTGRCREVLDARTVRGRVLARLTTTPIWPAITSTPTSPKTIVISRMCCAGQKRRHRAVKGGGTGATADGRRWTEERGRGRKRGRLGACGSVGMSP